MDVAVRGRLRYAIITPVRNEEAFFALVAQSVTRQSALPETWIVVDDGSTDRTPEIALRFADQYPWIRVVRRADRGGYRLGGGVVEAFMEGLSYLDLNSVDLICKLDADLQFEDDYFAQLLDRAASDARLGIISGVTYFQANAKLVPENVPSDFAIGMAKLWRVSCFRDIGGLVPALGWDVLDVVRAQMRGWSVRSYPELRILHLRPMSSRGSWYRGRVRNGLTDYLLGYHPLFEIVRCIYRMTHPPRVVGGLCILYGYVLAALRREERIVSAEELQFLRGRQLTRLFRFVS